MQYKFIVCIVPHNYGELLVKKACENGANGATIIMGKGTASNNVLQLLGLGETWKDIVYIIVKANVVENVKKSIIENIPQKAHFGVMFIQETLSFIKAGKIDENEKSEGKIDMQNEYEMINLIVNKGYADDAMAAARKAGASGGTIICAKGTAKEGDEKFFGIDIVPEKEMLMILVPIDKKNEIMESIKALSCFQKKGSGIIFCNKISDFTLLGK